MLASLKYGLLNTYPILASLVTGHYYPCRFVGGRMYLNIRESRFMLERALGSYESTRMSAVDRLLEPGSTFIDVGANKGDFALLAAGKVGNRGKVFCFEPEPENCRWIRESITLNGYENIRLFEMALSDREGEARLYLGRKSGFHTLVSPSSGQDAGVITVRTRSLDDLLSEIHHEKVNMMKIDVEGAELAVLKGAQAVLSRNPNVFLLIEVHPQHGVNPTEVHDFLTQLGFSIRRESPVDAASTAKGLPIALFAYRGKAVPENVVGS